VRKVYDSINAILCSGYELPAKKLWDVCNCDRSSLWLITDLIFDKETFSIFDWGTPEYELIARITLDLENSRPLGVYQPLNRKSFDSMCKLVRQQPDTLICLPKDTNLEEIKALLSKTENLNSCSDLLHLRSVLSTVKWFYGFDRDWADYGYSWFVSRDSKTLLKFDEMNRSENSYKLLSVF
jgi:hypothetical protein